VDSEPRIATDFKAVLAGIPRFFVGRMCLEGRRFGEREQAADAGGEEAGNLVATLFGGERGGVVGSHGTLQRSATHSDLRPATGALSGGNEKQALYLLLTQGESKMTEKASTS
jgi:hypothetical protein